MEAEKASTFVRDDCTVIAAPVQSDVDGIPKE